MTPQEREVMQIALPCPFCGSAKISVEEGSTFRWVFAMCDACGAQAGEVRKRTIGEGTSEEWEADANRRAIAEWNTRAALAQPETPYLTGARLFREGKGISFIPTAVRTDADIGEALHGWEDAKTAEEIAQPEREAYQEQVAWTDAQIGRAYKNSPELHKYVSSLAAFKRVTRAIEAMKGYTAPPQCEWQNLNAADMRELGISAIHLDMAKAISAKLREKNA